MKTKFFYFFVFISLCVLTLSCEKTSNCECNTPFVYNKYYNPGDIVSNRNACWMLRLGAGGVYITGTAGEPRDTFPGTQDGWIKICENQAK